MRNEVKQHRFGNFVSAGFPKYSVVFYPYIPLSHALIGLERIISAYGQKSECTAFVKRLESGMLPSSLRAVKGLEDLLCAEP